MLGYLLPPLRRQSRWRASVVHISIGYFAFSAMIPVLAAPGWAQDTAASRPINITSSVGQPFSDADKRAIAASIVATRPGQVQSFSNHKVRVLSVIREEKPGAITPQSVASRAVVQPFAIAIIFDYTAGVAIRAKLDTQNGSFLSEERLAGRPPASPEELEVAKNIVRADTEHAKLLSLGGVLEGGFIGDPPRSIIKNAGRSRFIEFQLLTADRRRIQRLVYVNLSTDKLVASTKP
jgi:hypothetical protein